METMEALPQTFSKDPVFRRLGKVARYAALNEKDKKAYKESLKAYRDGYAIAETERKLGRAEGREEGRVEGRAEGRAEERQESIRIMLSLGIAPETIGAKYDMPPEEVIKLAKDS